MQEQIDNIEKIQRDQGEMISKIHDAIVGDEFRKGLIDRVDKNTSYRKSDQKQKYIITGMFFGIGGLLGKYWGKMTDLFPS